MLAVAVAGVTQCWAANPRDVLINEIYVNSPDYYDRSEYIELYNNTGGTIDLAGWVLSGTEYDGTCGEHHHQFPSGTSIPPNGYIVIARDVVGFDGFEARFGFKPDLEMYDAGQAYEIDDPTVPNTICQNPDSYDDQIRFIPGPGDYAKSCGGSYNRYEVLYLYDSPSRTNLIDAMEYRYASCESDQCLGVNVSDDDAYPRYPDEGISLCRDESSTDTDDSSEDFYEAAPTPKAVNDLNYPPDVWSLNYSPCVPVPMANVTVSCYMTDDDGTILSGKCFYRLEGAADWDSLAMSNIPPDSLYSCDLPGRPDTAQVEFYVRAIDDDGAPTFYPGDAPEGAYHYSVGITSISKIQTVPLGADTSLMVGRAANTTGIVVTPRGVYNDYIFFIQDGRGPWSGLMIYDASATVDANPGDSVTVSGLITEYVGMTEMHLFSGCYTEESAGNPVPDPTVLSTGTLATSSIVAERYEAVLVRVEDVGVTNDSLGGGDWEVNDGSGGCIVGDYAYYYYTPVEGDSLDGVQGTYYQYGDYKIEPRGDDDLSGPVRIYSLVYSPHAPTSSDGIDVSCTVIADYLLTSVKLFYSTDDGASFDSTSMTSPDSVYSATVGPYPNDTVVDYYVEVWDNDGNSARKPGGGSYDFRVGLKTIYEVQYVPGPSDSSTYAGEPVNLAGVVTAATGEFSDYYFFIQDPDDAGKPAFQGVKVYDRTGTVVVSRGDSVTVSGDVWEYFNETEIAMFFPEAITLHSSFNPVPDPYSVGTAEIDTSEKWEGVLVAANTPTVIDPDAGFGEWLISNATPADTCRVGDYGGYTYTPTQSEVLAYVYGIGMYAYKKYILQPRDDDDICSPAEAGATEEPERSSRVMLSVRPNPVMDGAEVRFSLPAAGSASLKIYDVRGTLVRTLVEGEMAAGPQKAEWNGRSSAGGRVAPGIYFVRLQTPGGSMVNKVVVSR
jgi:hypothetical protein